MLDAPAIEHELTLDALDVGIIVLDAQAIIVGWNAWIANASNISRDMALGKSLVALFPNLANTRLLEAVQDSLVVGSSSLLTHSLNKLLPLQADDGSEILHNIVVRPISSAQAVSCVLQITDVTVSVLRDRVLRDRQNARYHAIVDSAREAIITTDSDGTIQWVNAAAQLAFGYSPTELLGRPINILLEAPETTADNVFAGTLERNPAAIQVFGRRKDGQRTAFAVSFGQWKAGDRIFTTTIWRDVTERLKAEVALRESESRHRALLEALPQLVFACAADGNCDYFNSQWEKYTGSHAEHHFGWAWLEIVHPEDRQGLESVWRKALAHGSVHDADVRLRGADSTYRWFKMRAVPVLAPNGNVTRWYGTGTDITDLIEARDTLRRSNDELEALVADRTREREIALNQLHVSQKMESIGQLTGGVAHDFNNLLAVILGSLSLLRKNLRDDPRTSRLIDGAIQGAERGATLTKRLLAFARRQELKLEAIEVDKVIPELMDFLRQSVGPGISIAVNIASDIHPVKIDANQFELALMNLAVNARDAMPKGGTLTITATEANADDNAAPKNLPRGDYVHISVADTGMGMDEVTLAKAMEPFFTTKGIGKGTGLGLSMVHGLTVQSGGAVHITSEPSKGTVVNLWLPRARREDVARESKKALLSAIDEASPPLRVLLVDDDALVSMNTAHMLMDLGHSVLEAPSAAHALRILETDSGFDIVITDYAMPGMTGLDLANTIKNIRPKMPIVMVTGYAELPANAALDFPRLSKPYRQEQLAEILKKVSRGGNRQSAEEANANSSAEQTVLIH